MSIVHEAWVRELDRLEDGLRRAEATAAEPDRELHVPVWEPPAISGPIPADLVDRAAGLLSRLEAARGTLSRSLSAVQGQLGFAAKVGDIAPAAGERRPVYLDVSC